MQKAVKNRPLFELRRICDGVILDDFNLLYVSFSSESGAVLTFFAYFLRQGKKSKWPAPWNKTASFGAKCIPLGGGKGQSPFKKYYRKKQRLIDSKHIVLLVIRVYSY